jgi:hypothetical protein
MALALVNVPDSFFEETALLLPGTEFQILADHFALGPDRGHFKFHHPQVAVSAVTWGRNPTRTMPYRAHCLLLIRLALAKHTNESAVVTRQLLRAYAAAAVSGQMKTLFPIATVRYNANYAARGAASVSLQTGTPSVYAALQASNVTDIIVALQACVPPVTDAFFLSWKKLDFGSLAALFGLLPPVSMGTSWQFSNAAGSKGSPWGPYFSWYSSPAPQVAPGLLGVTNQRAAAPLHRPESSALGCALWQTRLVKKVDLQIAASWAATGHCMGAVLHNMMYLG